jgi:hypothetical protein
LRSDPSGCSTTFVQSWTIGRKMSKIELLRKMA